MMIIPFAYILYMSVRPPKLTAVSDCNLGQKEQ